MSEDWLRTTWRPMMAYVYMAVVIFDFILAPVLWSAIQALAHGSVAVQWQPLTLIGGGIFHAAMGGVLGISAWTRGVEKITELREKTGSDTDPSI